MPVGEVDAGGIPDLRVAIGAFGTRVVEHAKVQEPEEAAGGAAAGDREYARALRLTALLKLERWKVNAKRIYRLYEKRT
jgi:hypothetical protein